MRHSRSCVLLLSIVAGCAIPSRDNPRDPSVAPLAKVVDRTDTTLGTCPAPAEIPSLLDALPEVVSANRSACLAIDARERDASDYHFSVLLPDGPHDLDELEIVPGVAAITPSDLQQWPVGLLEFRVEATRHGRRGVVIASVAITNMPPVAVGGPEIVVRRGGNPWTPGEAWVHFDGSRSFDPDGDPVIDWAWTFPAGIVAESGTSGDVVTARVIDPTPGRLRVELSVYDGADWSARTPVEVRVGEAPVWIATLQPGFVTARLKSLDPILTTFPTASIVSGASLIEPYALVAIEFGAVQLRTWPDGVIVDTEATSLASANVVTDSARKRFWLIDQESESFARVDLVGTNDIALASLITSTYDGGDFMGGGIGDVDAAGRLWIAAGFNRVIQVVGDDGVQLGRFELDDVGQGFLGMATRPGSDEVWALECRNPVAGGGPVPGRFHRLRYVGLPDLEDTPFPGAAAPPFETFFMAWVDHDRFWTISPGRGLLLVDASKIESGLGLDASILYAAEDVSDPGSIVVDAANGDAWVASSNGGGYVFRVSTRGDVTRFEAVGQSLYFVESDGSLVSSRDAVLQRGLGPSPDGVLVSLENAFRTLDSDGYGGLWVGVPVPWGFSHFGSDGTLLATKTQPVAFPGSPLDIFLALGLAVEPDGLRAWVLDGLGGAAGVLRLVLDSAGAGASIHLASPSFDAPNVDTNIFEAGLPGSDFVWMDSPTDIVQARTSGNTPVYDITGYQADFAKAARADDGDLCIALGSPASGAVNTLSVVRLPASGGAPVFEQLAVVTANSLTIHAVGAGTNPDMCWVSYETATPDTVATVAYAAVGLVDDVGDAVRRCSLWVQSPARMWAVRDAIPTGDCEGVPERLDLDPLGIGSWQSTTYDVVDTAYAVISP